MSYDVKPMRPIKLRTEEISAELVNDSLGEETPADFDGPWIPRRGGSAKGAPVLEPWVN